MLLKVSHLPAFAGHSLPEADVVAMYLATLSTFLFYELVPPTLEPM